MLHLHRRLYCQISAAGCRQRSSSTAVMGKLDRPAPLWPATRRNQQWRCQTGNPRHSAPCPPRRARSGLRRRCSPPRSMTRSPFSMGSMLIMVTVTIIVMARHRVYSGMISDAAQRLEAVFISGGRRCMWTHVAVENVTRIDLIIRLRGDVKTSQI